MTDTTNTSHEDEAHPVYPEVTFVSSSGELKRRMEERRRQRDDAIVQATLERAAKEAKNFWSPTMLEGDEQAQLIRALANDPAEVAAIIKKAEEYQE